MKIGIASGDRIPATRSGDGKPHWGGAGWVRLGQYVGLLPHEVVVGTLVWLRDHFVIVDEDSQEHDIDVIYMQRLMFENLPVHIKMGQAVGQKIINDLDDWYWGLDPKNHAFKASHPKTNPKENVNHYRSILTSSDLITVSTPYLAERLSALHGLKCNIEVVPNTVDVGRFTPHEHTDSEVPTIGWVGSTSHRSGDLEMMKGILNQFENTGHRFYHGGYHPGAQSFSTAVGLSPEIVTVIPATDPEVYPSMFVMDIGIAPLRDTPFNHAKSDIKALEYASAGVPWIGSRLPAYRDFAETVGGRVAKNPQQWIRHINELKSPTVRSAEGKALREAVWSRDISTGVKMLTELLDSLL